MLASMGYVVKITVNIDADGLKITQVMRDAYEDPKSGVKEFGEANDAFWADGLYNQEATPWRLLFVHGAGKGKTNYLMPRNAKRDVDPDILMQYVHTSNYLQSLALSFCRNLTDCMVLN